MEVSSVKHLDVNTVRISVQGAERSGRCCARR